MVIGIVSVVTEMKQGCLKEVGHHLHVPDPTLGSTLQFASVKAYWGMVIGIVSVVREMRPGCSSSAEVGMS